MYFYRPSVGALAMRFDPERVSTLFFDSYSTLVDVDAAAGPLAAYADDADSVSNLWRDHSLLYTMVANHLEGYAPFYDLNRQALTYALAVHGIDSDPETREEILAVYHDLDVFDDVREGMERLGEACDLYVLSNGNPEMLESMIDIADIGGLLDGFISADEIETYKPAAELYEHAADRTDTPIEETAHVSALWFDVQGAMNAGMQGVWADRKGDPWVRFDGEPDLTIETFHDLADELGV